jgi:hypothetical protein
MIFSADFEAVYSSHCVLIHAKHLLERPVYHDIVSNTRRSLAALDGMFSLDGESFPLFREEYEA